MITIMLFIKLTTCRANVNSARLQELFDSKVEYLQYELSRYDRYTTNATVSFKGSEWGGHLATDAEVLCDDLNLKAELENFLASYKLTPAIVSK